jgi:hypothetical protein
VIGALVLTVVAVAAPARVQVTATEYSLTLSRTAVKAGPAIVELVNLGEDPHDLRIQRIGVRGAKAFGVRKLESQGVGDVERKLAAGRYRLWCSIGDDAARGMRATLRVTK